jgi:hypothetical protein
MHAAALAAPEVGCTETARDGRLGGRSSASRACGLSGPVARRSLRRRVRDRGGTGRVRCAWEAATLAQ